MFLFKLSVLLILIAITNAWVGGGNVILYNPTDDVELLDTNNFKSVIIGSPKATIIKFFAHWFDFLSLFGFSFAVRSLSTI